MTLTSLNTENCTFQKKNKTREEDRLNKACEGGMDYGKRIKFITVILQGIKIHYLLNLIFSSTSKILFTTKKYKS